MFSDIIRNIQSFIDTALWIVVPFILLLLFLDLWLFYRRARYRNSLKWKVLELRIPKEVIKSPKAMEQVFAAAHNIWSFGINRTEKWWQGKVEPWTSFELVGRGQGVHFFMRVEENFRNTIESAIYAQYPDAEISEVPDYIQDFSPFLPDKNYNLFGSEFILAKDDGYPILTYPNFEERAARFEEGKIDPMAQIMEIMSNLKPSESLWIQIILRRANEDWKKKAEAEVAKLQGKKTSSGGVKIPGAFLFEGTGEFLGNLVTAPVQYPTWGEPVKSGEEKKPDGGGKQKIVEAIETKISKLGFESVIRLVYIDRIDTFTRANFVAAVSSFFQFSAPSLNAFKLNAKKTTFGKGLFKKFMARRRQRLLYDNYRIRHFPKKFYILNTEELATIYHPPLTGVKAVRLRRTEFKRGGPPADLPI